LPQYSKYIATLRVSSPELLLGCQERLVTIAMCLWTNPGHPAILGEKHLGKGIADPDGDILDIA
jgi:hypothetical protein